MKTMYLSLGAMLATLSLSSLAFASRFAQTCQTTNYFVSITDSPSTGELEYRSWRVVDGEPLGGAPNLVLTGGVLAGGGGNYGINFKNGEYSYSLQVRYTPEDDHVRYLKVTKGDSYKVILAEVCLY